MTAFFLCLHNETCSDFLCHDGTRSDLNCWIDFLWRQSSTQPFKTLYTVWFCRDDLFWGYFVVILNIAFSEHRVGFMATAHGYVSLWASHTRTHWMTDAAYGNVSFTGSAENRNAARNRDDWGLWVKKSRLVGGACMLGGHVGQVEAVEIKSETKQQPHKFALVCHH